MFTFASLVSVIKCLLFLAMIYAEENSLEFSDRYTDYERLTVFLDRFAKAYPDIVSVQSIGKSVMNRELWVIRVTDRVSEEETGEPKVKFVANVHGNEPVGRELLLRFAVHLVENYGQDENITRLVNSTDIYILPSLNPDGFEIAQEGECNGLKGRDNANGIDIFSEFPSSFNTSRSGFDDDSFETDDDGMPDRQLQPETLALMQWMRDNRFTLSVNFHGSELFVVYPFDASADRSGGQRSSTPDDDTFKWLAGTYVQNHLEMSSGLRCPGSNVTVSDGIVSGNDWFPVEGSMSDYNYVYADCLEITVEVSCCKYPPAQQLGHFWAMNRDALVAFATEVHNGIHGFVFDNMTSEGIENARIEVTGNGKPIRTSKHGDYWRILLPGLYEVRVLVNGYSPVSVSHVQVVAGIPTVLNFSLSPIIEIKEKVTAPTPISIEAKTGSSVVVPFPFGTGTYPFASDLNATEPVQSLVRIINRLHDASHREKVNFIEPSTFVHLSHDA